MQPQIIFSEPAAKEMRRLDRSLSKRILEELLQFAGNPDKRVIKLAGIPYFRLRAWDYYAIFDMQKNALRILVIRIRRPRKRTNKKTTGVI